MSVLHTYDAAYVNATRTIIDHLQALFSTAQRRPQDDMEQPGTDESGSASHAIAHHLLRTILTDFGLAQRKNGSAVTFIGEIPSLAETNSGKINLSYIGAIPSLANAIVATQIYEGRGGRPQEITLDLRKAHNYLDPNIGMTPTINGQVRYTHRPHRKLESSTPHVR